MYAVNLTSPTGGACLGEEVQPSVAALARETAQIVHLRDLLAGGHGLAGAARWQDLLHAHDRLFQDAVSCGALEYTPVDLRYSPRGHMQPLGFEVRPVNLRAASRELAALFLACVWLEANQHDHLTSGGREWAGPKYSAVELASWMGEVFGERVEPAVVVAAISFCAKGGAAQGCT